jgi:hypothetical protein
LALILDAVRRGVLCTRLALVIGIQLLDGRG